MGFSTQTLEKAANVLVLAAVCFVLFLLLMPNIDQGRNEARLAQAFIDVRRIRESTPAPATETLSDERDPWGEPYRIQPLPDGGFRVLSAGTNLTTPAEGFDEDDVASDMDDPPSRRIARSKEQQAMLTFACTFGTWLVGSVLILRRNRRISS